MKRISVKISGELIAQALMSGDPDIFYQCVKGLPEDAVLIDVQEAKQNDYGRTWMVWLLFESDMIDKDQDMTPIFRNIRRHE